jgi:eukaryotic-like serine/threonine-protein kinase
MWSLRTRDNKPLLADPLRGQRIPVGSIVAGKYHVGVPIGRGAWSTVYSAIQQPMQRDIALKVAGGATDDPTLRARFAREAKFLATIDHPNVVKVYELGWLETGPAAIAMERLQGETLADHLKREKRLTVPDALGLCARLCDALIEVHSHSIIHRDLKPANVFVTRDDGALVPKLLDFGIGRDLLDAERLTAAGQSLGTPAYLSPEQVTPKAVVDERTDLYTIGVLLYQCLTGRVPFDGPPMRVLTSVMREAPAKPSSIDPKLGPSIDGLLATLLAKSPRDRFQSAEEMRDALKASVPRS